MKPKPGRGEAAGAQGGRQGVEEVLRAEGRDVGAVEEALQRHVQLRGGRDAVAEPVARLRPARQ